MADEQVIVKRAPRADARRNREAILKAARHVFEAEGVLAPLDRIAMKAGIGNATLYRNFPTREDLLAAVMESDLDDAQMCAEAFSSQYSPRQALNEWLTWLTWRIRIWHDLPHCVAEAQTTTSSSMASAVSILLKETEKLLEKAQMAGDVVTSVKTNEVFELITALSWAVDRFGDDESTARGRVEFGTRGIFFSEEF